MDRPIVRIPPTDKQRKTAERLQLSLEALDKQAAASLIERTLRARSSEQLATLSLRVGHHVRWRALTDEPARGTVEIEGQGVIASIQPNFRVSFTDGSGAWAVDVVEVLGSGG